MGSTRIDLYSYIPASKIKNLNLDDGLDHLRYLEIIDLKNLGTVIFHERMIPYASFVWLDLRFRFSIYRNYQIPLASSCKPSSLRVEECSELKKYDSYRFVVFSEPVAIFTKARFSRNFGGEVVNLEGLQLCRQLKHLTMANLPAERILGLEKVKSLGSVELSECLDYLEEAPEVCSQTIMFLEDE